MCFTVQLLIAGESGGDTAGGNTRTHAEHDGEDPDGREYCTGDGAGGQVAARHSILSEREPKAKREVRIEAVPASEASWNLLSNHGDMQCLAHPSWLS